MQKIAFVVVPVVALAILALVFFRTIKREAAEARDAASASKSGGSAETARLRAELETLRAEVEKQKQRAAAAELKLAEASAAPKDDAVADHKKALEKKGDWKKRRDAELEAKIKAVDWRKRIKGLIDYWHEMEKSRLEGRPPKMTPEMTEQLMKLTAEAIDFAKFLGLDEKNPWKSFSNELLGAAWMDAFMQEVAGGTLTDGQLKQLRATDLYKDNDDLDDPNRNRLETWRELIEHNRAFGTATAGILSPDQHAQVLSSVSPQFMLSVYAEYSEQKMPSGAEAPQAVASYWMKNFDIPDAQRAAVYAVAADYVRRQAEIAAAVSAQYGGVKSRESEFDLLLKTIEAQHAAEKKLAETLQLDAEQSKKVLKGSDAVLRLGY
ncbi:MAG TPA: hypothetical protein VFS19_03530 [Planctomycetota bacterium]|nr:hypothetical protein [Planctomycetota bacterium]